MNFLPAPLERTLHDAATWYMVGVIWLIQLVHYPMFEFLDRATFTRSHAFHTSAITIVVMPAMCVELLLAGSILLRRGFAPSAVAGFVLVVLIWAVTFFVMVPLHGRLAGGYDADKIHTLVRWNWIRTVAWTARGAIVAFWL